MVELLIVIAIVGAMSMIVVPNFLTFIRANKIKASLRQVSTDVRSARQKAIAGNRRMMISYTTGAAARTYRVYYGTTDASGVTTYNVAAFSASNPTGFVEKRIEDGVTLQTTTFANVNDNDGLGWNDIVFASDGTIDNVPAGQTAGSFVLYSDAKIPKPAYTIKLYLTGRIETL